MKHNMLQDIDAVIFDMDGSLVDSMWIWKSIDAEYLGRYGIPLPETLQSEIEGMSFSETAAYFKEHFLIPDSLEEIQADWNRMAWDKYMYEVPLKQGIPEFLKGCKENGIKLGIATSNSRELVEALAGVHNLRKYFTSIVTVAKQLEVSPDRCLVFEDIVPGILAGRNAGMHVCAVEDAYSIDSRDKKRQLADYYIEDYREFY